MTHDEKLSVNRENTNHNFNSQDNINIQATNGNNNMSTTPTATGTISLNDPHEHSADTVAKPKLRMKWRKPLNISLVMIIIYRSALGATLRLLIASFNLQAAPFKTANELAADLKHRETIGLDCLKEVQLERAVVNKVVTTLEFPEEQKYKDFLTCSYKKQGFQNAEGKMLYDNINDFLSNFYSVSDLKSLDGCKRVKGSTHREIAYNSMRCILATLQRIEEENKLLAENKI